jgi:hypothetical protein
MAATDRGLIEDLCGDAFGVDLQRLGRVGLRHKSRAQKKHCRMKFYLHGSSFSLPKFSWLR